MRDDPTDHLAKSLEDELTDRFGPVLASAELTLVLGYSTPGAFRQSVVRRTVPVPVFRMPNRRGHFALTRDVAHWLAMQRQAAINAER